MPQNLEHTVAKMRDFLLAIVAPLTAGIFSVWIALLNRPATQSSAPKGTGLSSLRVKQGLRPWLRSLGYLGAFASIIGLGVGIYQIVDGRGDNVQNHKRYAVLVPLYASPQEYMEYIEHATGPDSLTLIETFSSEKVYSRKVSKDVLRTVRAAYTSWWTRGNKSEVQQRVRFIFFPEGTHDQSSRRAFDTAIRSAERAGYEVVASIGHITSGATRRYGKLYGERGIPVIMPMATGSELPHLLRSEDSVPAVLRLVPSNQGQAQTIANLLRRRGATGALVVEDLSNTDYANDLVGNFRTPFVTASGNSARGLVLAVLPTGGDHGSSLLNISLRSLSPDALLLFGMTEPSLEAVLHALATGLTPEYTVFTDGAVDEDLLPRVRALANRLPARPRSAGLPRIFMAFPLDNPLPREVGELFPRDSDRPADLARFSMTHALYVSDAVQITLSILDQNVLRQPGVDGRDAVSDRINAWAAKGEIADAVYSYSNARTYVLDGFGNTTNWNYHIFVAEGPEFTHWQLDTTRCPIHSGGSVGAPPSRPALTGAPVVGQSLANR